ncbi:MAG: hypothetical protein LBK73_05620 [Treponema sp.]|nr:hypothetical protein [Treponema sp.]
MSLISPEPQWIWKAPPDTLQKQASDGKDSGTKRLARRACPKAGVFPIS